MLTINLYFSQSFTLLYDQATKIIASQTLLCNYAVLTYSGAMYEPKFQTIILKGLLMLNENGYLIVWQEAKEIWYMWQLVKIAVLLNGKPTQLAANLLSSVWEIYQSSNKPNLFHQNISISLHYFLFFWSYLTIITELGLASIF